MKPCFGAPDNELALELCQCREDADYETAVGGRGVDVGPLPRQHPQADAALHHLVDEVDEVLEVAPGPIELSSHRGVARSQGFQAGSEPGPIVLRSRGMVIVESGGIHPGRQERIALQVCGLATVGLAHAHM